MLAPTVGAGRLPTCTDALKTVLFSVDVLLHDSRRTSRYSTVPGISLHRES